MFKLETNPKFWATVTVRPLGDSDAEPETFRAEFVALSVEDAEGRDLKSSEATKAFLQEVFTGLDDVEAADGSRLTFTVALRDRLIDTVNVRGALVKAYFEALYKAAAGN